MTEFIVSFLTLAYMKTRGIDPKANGLPRELERVKEAISRAKQIADRELAPKVDVAAAKRFIRSGLWGAIGDETPTTSQSTDQEKSADKFMPPASKKPRLGTSSVNLGGQNKRKLK